MLGGFLKFFGLFDKVIDKAVVDKDQARQLKHEIRMAAMSMEAKQFEAAASIITAEAQGEGFLQKNWRPMTMLWFVFLIGLYWFGLAPEYLVNNPELVSDLFGIVQVGIGGYVVGRSAEKIMKTYKEPDLEKARKDGDDNGG